MRKDVDYEVDEKKRTISVLEPGITKVEDYLGIDNLYDSVNTPLISFMNNAIKAKELFRNDKEYVVLNGEVLIVDEHTGRMLAGRRYNEGLHQAIEAKEGVEIREEYQTLATVTLQNYFRLYEQALRHDRHGDDRGLGVRQDLQARRGADPDQQAAARAPTSPTWSTAPRRRSTTPSSTTSPSGTSNGQPVLVGTVSVEKSELLSGLLKQKGIPHTVLNAKQHESEAKIVALAGHKGAVTVATNMAGRGTDIMLGGSVEFLADQELRTQGLDPLEDSEAYERRLAGDGRARSRTRSRPSTTRSRRPAASTSSAPSATSRAASTTSCAVVPAARATRASPGSTCRSRTS